MIESTELDPISLLYPNVDEVESPLPRVLNPSDKYALLALSHNNLRLQYTGLGKNHNKDAASVRADHPVPTSCGIYYFEATILSKGRDGYIGIGMSLAGTSLNRLPGWDKDTWGYHADDGNSFCSSGTGQAYGPVFATGDVVGCCINYVNNTCFYTKNGINLGVVFSKLPPDLYPMVGMQTPGEELEVNFGQQPFAFDFQDHVKEWKRKVEESILQFSVPEESGDWHTSLNKLVSTYLVHHGYCSTAEAFAQATGQSVDEKINSIKNRQRIQRLVLDGRIGESIELTRQLYPGLLESKPDLLFRLKCRQFVEMISGSDSEIRAMRSPKLFHGSARSSPCPSPPLHHSRPGSRSGSNSPSRLAARNSPRAQTVSDLPSISESTAASSRNPAMGDAARSESLDETHVTNGIMNGSAHAANDQSMDTDDDDDDLSENGKPDPGPIFGMSNPMLEHLISFGRELYQMQQLSPIGDTSDNKKLLQDAFSLLAYADPWASPVGHQLDAKEREPVCAALNSAILSFCNLPKQPPLELILAQTKVCLNQMRKEKIGSSAFANVDDSVLLSSSSSSPSC